MRRTATAVTRRRRRTAQQRNAPGSFGRSSWNTFHGNKQTSVMIRSLDLHPTRAAQKIIRRGGASKPAAIPAGSRQTPAGEATQRKRSRPSLLDRRFAALTRLPTPRTAHRRRSPTSSSARRKAGYPRRWRAPCAASRTAPGWPALSTNGWTDRKPRSPRRGLYRAGAEPWADGCGGEVLVHARPTSLQSSRHACELGHVTIPRVAAPGPA